MAEEQKPVKRIVSWGEYLRIWMWKIVNSAFLCIVLVAISVGFLVFVASVISIIGAMLPALWIVNLVLGISGLIASLWIAREGITLIKEIVEEDDGVPAALANTLNLAPTESLVRPSAKPVEPQQAVLLRAASRINSTPAEQLVRPVGGSGD